VLTGREAYHWCLAPTLIAEVSDALTDCDPKASTTILRLGRQRLHLTAPGSLAGATFEADTLRCATRYLPGGEYQVLVSPLAAVEAVLVDGAPLDRGDFEVVPPGLLRIRVRQAGDEAQLEVRGCRFTQLAAALNLAGIANGGFEEGLQGWAPSDPGAVSPSTDAHSGENALLLDARGLTREVQCPSTPIAVQEGKSYELVSWVKQLAGEGKYKVTIDWLGLGGHLSYANDWQGADRPAAYARHGGRFTAPAGAKAVVIILGVHPGTACLFDDVALDPAP